MSPHLRHLVACLYKTIAGYLLYCLGVLWLEAKYLQEDITLSSDFQAVASLFLGSLLALRLNTCHSRWWEARTLWGRLVNTSRSLAVYVASLPSLAEPERRRIFELLVEFSSGLKDHLRGPAGAVHAPSQTSYALFQLLGDWKREGRIDSWEWSRVAELSEGFLQVCGGCERIRSSPLPRSFHLAILACIWLYLAAAPLVLHQRPWTLPLVLLLSVFFLSLEQIAYDLDEPFGLAPEDIPMERLCGVIQTSSRQILLPDAAPPQAH